VVNPITSETATGSATTMGYDITDADGCLLPTSPVFYFKK
jgi:hypothetical protein